MFPKTIYYRATLAVGPANWDVKIRWVRNSEYSKQTIEYHYVENMRSFVLFPQMLLTKVGMTDRSAADIMLTLLSCRAVLLFGQSRTVIKVA